MAQILLLISGVTLVVLVWFSATGFMVIHPLVVNSLNKILPRLKANAVESANLRAS